MATCVQIISPGAPVATLSGDPVVNTMPLLGVDPSCASGLLLMTQADLKLQVSPEPTDPQRVTDMYELFLAFMVVFAMVWGLKQLRRIFGGDMERD